jgi:hypothetical protein
MDVSFQINWLFYHGFHNVSICGLENMNGDQHFCLCECNTKFTQ